jgi:hypothetical protein
MPEAEQLGLFDWHKKVAATTHVIGVNMQACLVSGGAVIIHGFSCVPAWFLMCTSMVSHVYQHCPATLPPPLTITFFQFALQRQQRLQLSNWDCEYGHRLAKLPHR